MNFALNPYTRAQMDAETYIKTFGRKQLGQSADNRPEAVCETCRQNMSHVAGKTEDSWGHFSHKPKSGYCPTKSSAALPYGRLTPVNPDPVRAQKIRQLVMTRWRWVFHELAHRVPLLDALEFVELIRVADGDGLWGYRNLELRQVPELLLMVRDFTPLTSRIVYGSRRKFWFRFWFSANVARIDDLWITPPGEVTIFRASFSPPIGRKKLPDLNDLKKLLPMKRVDHVPDSDPDIEYPYALKTIPSLLKCQ